MTDRNEALRLADRISRETDWYEFDHVPWCNEAAALLRQQAKRIAELEKLQDESSDVEASLRAQIAGLTAERDQLRAEVERLMADAERYRWLRDNFESEWAICEWQDDPDGLGYYRDARAPEVVDAAIDHARTTHKDEG